MNPRRRLLALICGGGRAAAASVVDIDHVNRLGWRRDAAATRPATRPGGAVAGNLRDAGAR